MLRTIDVGSVLAERYELQALLGRGGMGLVFKALDRKMGEVLALKVLLPGVELSPEVRSRFRDEAKLAWKVSHRNVCAVRNYDEDGDLPFIVMELVEGIDLKRFLHKVGAMEWEDGFDVSLQVSEGLGAIHDVGIVHRDLKPANITRDARGIVKVMDFGIAKGGTQPGITDDGKLVCTIDYVSPEQILGASVDPRSDLYSFGIVIYELFTGRVPFRGDTPAATMRKHVEERPPLHGVAASLIPESLVPVLEVALSKEPIGRFKGVQEMRVALVRARDEMRKRGTSPVVPANGHSQGESRRRPLSGPYPREALLLVPALVRALGSADRGIRTGAAEALARTPHPSARGPLEAAVEDEDREVRERAKDALRRLTPRQEIDVDALTPAFPDAPSTSSPTAPRSIQSDVGSSSVKEALAPASDVAVPLPVPPAPSADASQEPGPRSEPVDFHEELIIPPLEPVERPSPPPPPPKPRPIIPAWVYWFIGALVVALLTIALGWMLSPPAGTTVQPTPTPLDPPPTMVATSPPTTAPPATSLPAPPTRLATPRPPSTTLITPPPTTLAATPTSPPTTEPPVTTLPPAPPEPPTPLPTPPPPAVGTLVEASDPALVRPACVTCPQPKPPLIAEDPRYLSELGENRRLVELRILVDENGRVTEATALKGDKALADSALKAVRGWKYTPARKQGVNVKVWLIVPVQFVLPPPR